MKTSLFIAVGLIFCWAGTVALQCTECVIFNDLLVQRQMGLNLCTPTPVACDGRCAYLYTEVTRHGQSLGKAQLSGCVLPVHEAKCYKDDASILGEMATRLGIQPKTYDSLGLVCDSNLCNTLQGFDNACAPEKIGTDCNLCLESSSTLTNIAIAGFGLGCKDSTVKCAGQCATVAIKVGSLSIAMNTCGGDDGYEYCISGTEIMDVVNSMQGYENFKLFLDTLGDFLSYRGEYVCDGDECNSLEDAEENCVWPDEEDECEGFTVFPNHTVIFPNGTTVHNSTICGAQAVYFASEAALFTFVLSILVQLAFY